jgi:Asparagine synthase
VEFAATIPTSQRVGRGTLKELLKRALRGLLGPESLDRGKQGFSMPLDMPGLFRDVPETARWPPAQRAAWTILKRWTQRHLGTSEPAEVFREGP